MVLKVCGLKHIIGFLIVDMTIPEQKDIKKEFGARLRYLRSVRQLSQENLADLCSLDRSYIGGVERGERNISLVNMKKISDALCLSPKEFFDD